MKNLNSISYTELELVALSSKKKKTVVNVDNLRIGIDFILIAGPCSVENEKQMILTAQKVKELGANMLRGGAYKPRTSPYSFQGLGVEGLKILKKAKEETGLPIVTEVMDTRDIDIVCKYADVLQLGARNMQNYSLIKEVGRTNKPVLLKRGMSCTLLEWLGSAEHIMNEGNSQVILCERGISTFETYTRYTLDLSSVPAVKELSHLPVIVDPSHGTGRVNLVESMSLAAVAAGADGLMVEVHYHPDDALSDKDQTMTPGQFKALVEKLRKMNTLVNSFELDKIENKKKQGVDFIPKN
ncbi:MAG: 3-deoxy-7-phosphoheptulonate synthase [Candidatus Aminicenantes bacterium]|nr:3-deoxy-7-phosphoheptulonate synthase [Candidatus Aminicenantes bacterium]